MTYLFVHNKMFTITVTTIVTKDDYQYALDHNQINTRSLELKITLLTILCSTQRLLKNMLYDHISQSLKPKLRGLLNLNVDQCLKTRYLALERMLNRISIRKHVDTLYK